MINSTIFLQNKGNVVPNCLLFRGDTFLMQYSIFLSNIPYGNANFVALIQNSGGYGSMDILGNQLLIQFSYFFNNTKTYGGGISINNKVETLNVPIVIIRNCLFVNNSAVMGGGVNFNTIYPMKFILLNSIFLSNWGTNSILKKIIFFFQIYKFFLLKSRWRSIKSAKL